MDNRFCLTMISLLFLTAALAFAAETVGRIESDELTEISGLAVSPSDPNRLWVHNDSGDTARFFAVDPTGQTLGVWSLAQTHAFDWEDIAAGPGPEDDRPYLYIGDIGDNKEIRPNITVYRIPLPMPGSNPEISQFDTLLLQYPDGPHDAEALLVDPATKDILIISKKKKPCKVYISRYPQQAGQFNRLEEIGSVPIAKVNGGDISPDGRRLLLRNGKEAFLWTKQNDEDWKAAFSRKPQTLPLAKEPNGESIAFGPDSRTFYTVSEEKNPLLYHYKIE